MKLFYYEKATGNTENPINTNEIYTLRNLFKIHFFQNLSHTLNTHFETRLVLVSDKNHPNDHGLSHLKTVVLDDMLTVEFNSVVHQMFEASWETGDVNIARFGQGTTYKPLMALSHSERNLLSLNEQCRIDGEYKSNDFMKELLSKYSSDDVYNIMVSECLPTRALSTLKKNLKTLLFSDTSQNGISVSDTQHSFIINIHNLRKSIMSSYSPGSQYNKLSIYLQECVSSGSNPGIASLNELKALSKCLFPYEFSELQVNTDELFQYPESLIKEIEDNEFIEIPVQINGKKKSIIHITRKEMDNDKDFYISKVFSDPHLSTWFSKEDIANIIIKKGKIISIVTH